MKKRSNSQRSQKATVKAKGAQERVTIGMDLGNKTSRYRMLSNEGEILREEQVATTKAGMVEAFGSLGRIRIAIEVGTHSPWVSRLLQSLGHETIVANPKQVKLITESSRKDDRLDAQTPDEARPSRRGCGFWKCRPLRRVHRFGSTRYQHRAIYGQVVCGTR
jgi:transposase